ncbi:peptidase [Sphingobium sp. BS19]|uniref:peptidase n=1 Tax=Sphingobium sp. BS19 TaxID=3018973 RepID=UPI0022ED6C02|nr:peptidase [Sphingobium sp. BS19]GLI97230.1 hypothetical protein Sbs19_10480 [Sphingobium sp. BS19]
MAFHLPRSMPRSIFIGLASLLALGGCAYDDGYGYGGMSVGTGYAGDYYGPASYGPGGYGNAGYGGWYNDFYYPGTGYYVFDRGGRRHRWNDGQRSYWEGRRAQYRGRGYVRDRDGDGRPDAGRGPGYHRGRDYVRDRNGDGRPDPRGYARPDRRPDGQPGRPVDGRRYGRPDGGPDRSGYRQRGPDMRGAPGAGSGQGVRTERARPAPQGPRAQGREAAPRTQPE